MLAISSYSHGRIFSIWKNNDYYEHRYCITHLADYSGYYIFSAKTGYGTFVLEYGSGVFLKYTNNKEWRSGDYKVKVDGNVAYLYNKAAINHELLSPTTLTVSVNQTEDGHIDYIWETFTDDTSFTFRAHETDYTVWKCDDFKLEDGASNVFKAVKGRYTHDVTIKVKSTKYYKQESYYYENYSDYSAAGIYFLCENGKKTSSAVCVGVQYYGFQGVIKNYPYMYNGKLEYVDLNIEEHEFVKDVEKTTVRGKIHGNETVIETDKYKNPSVIKFYAETSLGFYIYVDIKVKLHYAKNLFYYTKREALDPNIPKEDKVTFTTSIEIKEKNEKGEDVIREEILENELFFYCTKVRYGNTPAYNYIFNVPLWAYGD